MCMVIFEPLQFILISLFFLSIELKCFKKFICALTLRKFSLETMPSALIDMQYVGGQGTV